jgi:hypothetical protein
MPRQKMSKAEFWEIIGPLLADPDKTPTIKEMAQATGLSEGGVYYKLKIYGIQRKTRYIVGSIA